MLRISGEMSNLVEQIDFDNKSQLMKQLRSIRLLLPDNDSTYDLYREFIGVTIQQVFYINESQLLKYKSYCNYRGFKGAVNEK